MKGHLIGIVCGLIAATAFSATPDAAAVRRAKEQLALFKPEAARRAMADLKSNPKYDWAKHNAAVEALIAKADEARAALAGKDAAKQAEAVLLGCISQRVAGKLDWDAAQGRFSNSDEANALLAPYVRPGWEIG